MGCLWFASWITLQSRTSEHRSTWRCSVSTSLLVFCCCLCFYKETQFCLSYLGHIFIKVQGVLYLCKHGNCTWIFITHEGIFFQQTFLCAWKSLFLCKLSVIVWNMVNERCKTDSNWLFPYKGFMSPRGSVVNSGEAVVFAALGFTVCQKFNNECRISARLSYLGLVVPFSDNTSLQ